MIEIFKCLLCQQNITRKDLAEHKASHHEGRRYGIMWPITDGNIIIDEYTSSVPTFTSPLLASMLGVKQVYIRDEGKNLSGSMKDYIVKEAVNLGITNGFNVFTVISSGNHAFSLATFAGQKSAKAIIFTTGTSSTVPMISPQCPFDVVAASNCIDSSTRGERKIRTASGNSEDTRRSSVCSETRPATYSPRTSVNWMVWPRSCLNAMNLYLRW